MTKSVQKEDDRIVDFETSSGLKVKMDLNRATTRLLIKARTYAEGGFKTTPFLLAEICLFDGKKLNAEELMDEIDPYDYIEIEEMWASQKKSKTSKTQIPTI